MLYNKGAKHIGLLSFETVFIENSKPFEQLRDFLEYKRDMRIEWVIFRRAKPGMSMPRRPHQARASLSVQEPYPSHSVDTFVLKYPFPYAFPNPHINETLLMPTEAVIPQRPYSR